MKKPKHIVRKFMKVCYRAHKPYFFTLIFKCLVNAFTVIFNAYSLSILIQYLEKNVYKEALIVGGIIVLLNFIFYFLNKLIQRIEEQSNKKMVEGINHVIGKKLAEIPFQFLEDPYYLDLKDRAKFSIENQDAIYQFIKNFADLIQKIITLIGLMAIMILFDFRLILILVIALFLNLVIMGLSLKTQLKFFNDLIPINRKYGYYLNTLLDEKNGKDFRMNEIGELVIKRFEDFGDQTAIYFKKLAIKMSFFSSLMQIIKYTEMFFIYGFVLLKTLNESLSISAFSLYISTALSFSTTMNGLVTTGLEVLQVLQYITPFVELMELKEEKEIGKNFPFKGKIKSIEFKEVSFMYPNTTEMILQDINFMIHEGEKISVVGLNGAGKTTLVKLLCRLYKPVQGEILVNGVSIFDYEIESYLKEMSAVFQDFKLFAYSIRDNITNGTENPSKDLSKIIEEVGLKDKIERLDRGIDSLYTKSFDEDGIELSGGESQKIAIARALYRDSSLIILDEPTASLDPLAEAEIYENFNDLVKDKTAIYISHRMSSSVFCDKILVIEKGKVVDYESHKNLMKKVDSLYYKLFMAQAKNYQL